jgi:dipeptidyl aminopeptidase/acylaminoacyl peptidase
MRCVTSVLIGLGAAGPLAAQDSIRPPASLVAEGVPGIPRDLADRAGRYTQYRQANLLDWHPLRREALISTRFGDVPQLHLVRAPGAARRQLTFLREPVGAASWQPTRGDYLVFRRDQGGDEFYQLYRYDLTDGRITLLTDGRSRNTGGVWNRAGTRLAYESTRRNGTETDIWVVDPSDPASDRMAVEMRGTGWSAHDWSPDGRQLLLGHTLSANQSEVWLADATTGRLTLVTVSDSGQKVSYPEAVYSRDGKGLYLTTDRDNEFTRLGYLDLATRRLRILSSAIPWDVEEFVLSDDGALLAFIANEGGYGRLHLLATATATERRLPALPNGLVGSLHWRRGTHELGFTLSSSRAPDDVWSLDVATGRLARWTESETGGLDFSDLPEPELIRWPAPDGLMISGLLYRPAARFSGPRPVVVSIHGGPEGQARPDFLGRWNYLLKEQGVALVLPNIRGSTGFGKTYLASDNGPKREQAYADIGALLDWIRGRPELDASRVLVMGGSYGGHMTLVTAYRYADRISCAVDVVGISNLATFLENTSSYRRDLRRVEYGDERDPADRAFMERTAPVNNATTITKPLFVVQGANDPRVPRSEAEQITATLRQLRTPVWYLLGLDEGHGFQKKANADFQFYATLAFAGRYLVGEITP